MMTNRHNALKCYADFKELKTYSSPQLHIILIGNKIDLENNRKVSTEEAERLANELGIQLFLETSAKTGYNASELFINAGKILYQDYLQNKSKKGSSRSKSDSFGEKSPRENRIKLPTPKQNDTFKRENKEKCCK